MDGEPLAGGTLGVVGDDHAPVVDAAAAAGVDVETGAAETVLDGSDLLVALGEAALVDLVRAGLADTGVAVLPVGAGPGTQSVPRASVGEAVRALAAGDWERTTRPALSVAGEFDAVFELMLSTAEPARISEYTVRSGATVVSTFRADAVVVTTPTGSPGYARAADGPVLAPGTGVVGVVPVAPFATDTDRWVLPESAVSLTVERDEAPVELLVDGRSVGQVEAGESLRIDCTRRVAVALVGSSAGFFEEQG